MKTERYFDPRGSIAEYGYFAIIGLELEKIDGNCRVIYRLSFPTNGDKQMFICEHCGKDYLSKEEA